MGAKIMHCALQGPGVYFMASDSPRQGDGAFAGFSLSLDPATIAEAERSMTRLPKAASRPCL